MENNTEEKKSLLDANISFKGVNLTQKLVFAKYLSVMLKSGLTISESLDIIHDQATGKFRKIIKGVLKSVLAGNTLSASLNKYSKIFSGIFVNAVYAGEASGTLEGNLYNISEQLKKQKELLSKVKTAMLYPVIVMGATLVLGLAMAFLVLPKIIPLFEGLDMDLPATTRFLIWFSNLIQDHTMSILAGILFFSITIFWAARQKFAHPVTHYLFLHMPLIKGISRNANLANFCSTLGTMLKNGLNIDEALEVSKKAINNYYYKKSLDSVSRRVSQGVHLSEGLKKYDKYFPKMTISMIKVGEKSGNLEEVLFYLSEFYEIEVDNSTKALSTAIEPVLLIFIGLAVGGMALSIITPIYQITGNIQR